MFVSGSPDRTPAIFRYTAETREAVPESAISRDEIYTGFSLGSPFVHNLTGLAPATTYTFVYIASNVEGSSPPSTNLTFTTLNGGTSTAASSPSPLVASSTNLEL